MAVLLQRVRERNSIADEARNLFTNLIGIQDEEVQQVQTRIEINQTEQLRQVGARIGNLCDRLERTPEGQEIIRLANEINLDGLTEEGLQEVIGGLFGSGGGDDDDPGKGDGWWLRIIGFFSFCKNLFIRGCNAVINACKTVFRNVTKIVNECFSWIDSFFERLM